MVFRLGMGFRRLLMFLIISRKRKGFMWVVLGNTGGYLGCRVRCWGVVIFEWFRLEEYIYRLYS